MRSPKSRIVDAAMPFVAQGAAALALAALLAGCDCTSRFLMAVEAAEGEALRQLADGGDLPQDSCDTLCVPPDAPRADGGPPPASATEAGFAVSYCRVVQDGEELAVYCEGLYPDRCIGGRRPALLAPRATGRGKTGLDDEARSEGASFAALARLESASVVAFVELAVELHAHGAPAALVRRALGAAVDEVRHAGAAAGLALARGAAPETAVVALAGVRPLSRILIDNATEGMAREAWGAVAMAADARDAKDPVVRRTLAEIAADEAGHAELARAIDAWAGERAGPAARARARDARVREVESLVSLVEAGAGAGGKERSVARVRAFARAHLSA